MRSHRLRASTLLAWLLLLAAYAFSVGAFALYGAHNLNFDMSSEMVLAQLLNDEGRLLTDSWYYSTELRIVSPVSLYQLGLKLFSSWHAARTFAVALSLAGVAAAVIYLARRMGLRDAAPCAAAALVLPLSGDLAFYVTYGGFYTVYIMLTCALTGMTLRMGDDDRVRPARLAAMLLLSLWGGLVGVRMLMLLAAPLGLSCALALANRARRCETLREAARTPAFRRLCGVAAITAALLIGWQINARVLGRYFSFRNYSGFELRGFSSEALLRQVDGLVSFFGFSGGHPLLSLPGLADMAAVALAILMAFAARRVIAGRVPCGDGARLVALYAACGVPLGMLLSGLISGGAWYYIGAIVMLVLTLFLFLEKLPCRLPALRAALLLGATLIFLLEARATVSTTMRASRANYEEAADYLVEHGYTLGFATLPNGSTLTEASDGKLEVVTYGGWSAGEPYDWLQKKSHFGELPPGKVFVFIEAAEPLEYPPPVALPDHLEAVLTGGTIYAYDSAEEVVALMRENRAKLEAERAAQAAQNNDASSLP